MIDMRQNNPVQRQTHLAEQNPSSLNSEGKIGAEILILHIYLLSLFSSTILQQDWVL